RILRCRFIPTPATFITTVRGLIYVQRLRTMSSTTVNIILIRMIVVMTVAVVGMMMMVFKVNWRLIHFTFTRGALAAGRTGALVRSLLTTIFLYFSLHFYNALALVQIE